MTEKKNQRIKTTIIQSERERERELFFCLTQVSGIYLYWTVTC